jgi:mRNA interferase RelE/StbE
MRKVQFLPAATRDFGGLDQITQQRIVAALERFAATGHGNVKKLKGRNDFRLRVGKWRVFFDLEAADAVTVIGIDNRGQAY